MVTSASIHVGRCAFDPSRAYARASADRVVDESLSMALHKDNVFIDLSGWSPKYFPPQLIHYANTQLKHKMLFGTDYPLSVFHLAAWGRVGFGTLRKMMRTTNRFDRQVEVCRGLDLGFRSLGDLLPHTAR